MIEFFISIDWVNILTIIVAPVIAVWVGQKLQNIAKLREDKMQIFKSLMTSRAYGWTYESVHSLNIIDIVFADDKRVREAWNVLFDKLANENPTETDLQKIKIAKDKLIEEIAVSLGYKDKVTWETIQNPYIPKGMSEQLAKNLNTQDNFSDAISVFLSMIMQQQNTAEENLNKDNNEEM